MDLEKAGIELTEKGKIKVDATLCSTNTSVYVIGDAAGKYMCSYGQRRWCFSFGENVF